MMRLTCPNCGAQYQVAEGAIPAAGRDVQCSNCNHVWFEVPGAVEDAAPIDIPDRPASGGQAPAAPYDGDGVDSPAPDPLAEVRRTVEQSARRVVEPPVAAPAPVATPQPTPEPAPIAPPVAQPAPVAQPVAQPVAEPQPTAPAAQVPPAAQDRPRMTEEIRDILKEEAARETEARRAERPAPEPDIDVAPPRSAAETEARETRFPDIDQINSSLRGQDDSAGTAAAAAAVAAAPKSGRSFWRAFWVMFLLVLLALLAYLLAPTLAEAMPGLKAPLIAYVTWVDSMRLWIMALIG